MKEMTQYKSFLIVGCGLTGSVIARHLADLGHMVEIWDRRTHIGGNLYDYVDEHGYLVQKYGPHAFHTSRQDLYDYICRYEQWQPYALKCGAVWDGNYTPTPFNFSTIDTFYRPKDAALLKEKLKEHFAGRETAVVTEVLTHPDPDIRQYAQYLFEKDYAPYTAKQWGVSPDRIDSSVLKRVPLRFSYKDSYFDDVWQVLPVHSYVRFFENLLHHPNIHIRLNIEARDHLRVSDGRLWLDGEKADIPVIYTGALDELFDCMLGCLPYRSLRFEWGYDNCESLQPAPVVAYPQAESFTRITEFKKLPPQKGKGTSYAVEHPIPYDADGNAEPYYPILTEDSRLLYQRYRQMADQIPNLICCGRLADFQYYNMDQALDRALQICKTLG